MGIRTGIDLVAVADVQASLDAHGERYLTRVYTAGERADCTRADGTVDAERLAARYAAKEALVKALRLGEGTFAWTDVELRRADAGHPVLSLHRDVAATASAVGVRCLDVSFSHEAGLASAVVVALIETP